MSIDVLMLVIAVPFVLGMVLLGVAQKKFFYRYKEVFHPKNPISTEDLVKMYMKDSTKASRFLKNNFFQFGFLRGNLYLKKYEDAKLNRYALSVRLIFFSLIFIILLGFIVFVFV